MADGIPVETNPGYIPNSANTAFLDWLRGKAKGRGVPTWDTPKGNPTYGRIGGYPGWEPGMPRAPGNTPMPGSNRLGGTYAPSNNMPVPTQTPPIPNTGGVGSTPALPPGGSGLPSVGSGPPPMGSGLPSGGGAMPPGGGTRALPPPLGGGAFGAGGGTIPGGVRGAPTPPSSLLGNLGSMTGAAGLGAAAAGVGSSPDVGWPARTKGADPLAVLQKLRQQQGGSPAQPPPASFNDRFGPTPIPNAPATPPPAQPIPPAVAGATPPTPVGGGGAGIGMGSSPPPGWNPQQPIEQWPKQPSPAAPAPAIPMPRPRPAVRPPAPRSSITVGPKAWAMSPQQYAQAHRPQQQPGLQSLLSAIFGHPVSRDLQTGPQSRY